MLPLLALPILHHHGDTGGATAIFFLSDERNIQPHTRLLGGQNHTAERQADQELRDRTEHEWI